MKVFEPKILSTLKNYDKKSLLSDVIAGVIVAIIALPLSLALAIASNVSPTQGLYTAIFAGFTIALFGGSKVNISGPTAAFATIVATIATVKGTSALILATVVAGILLMIMGLLRLGTLIKYIPKTITVGFTAGIAVTLVIGQLSNFLGVEIPKTAENIETIDKIKNIINNISTIKQPYTIIVGVLSLAVLIVWGKFIKKIPASLIAVILFSVLVWACKIPTLTIGEAFPIEKGFPPFAMPEFNLDLFVSILPDAFTIALLAGIESLLSCVVSDNMIGDTHNPNTELIAQGLGNVCSGLFGGIPATGAIARTAANVKNGGRSPIAGMIHAVVLLLVLLLLVDLAAMIPLAVIASILFIVAYNMSEWRSFVKIIKTKKVFDILVLVLTFILTVVKDLVVAIAVGLVVHYAIVLITKIIEKKKSKKA